MDLIKNNASLLGNKFCVSYSSRNIHGQGVNIERTGKEGFILFVLMKIEIDNMLIVLAGKIKHRACFSALATTFDNQRFVLFF